MKGGTIALIVALVVVLLGGLICVGTYNGIVTSEENVKEAYADIETQLTRRTDLIPNLVNSVKGYMAHETEVINSVTSARENLLKANGAEEKAAANDKLTEAVNNFLVVVENYPDLKANQNFIQLQDELAGTENRIAVARNNYNEKVAAYNKEIKLFPKNIIAGMFGFTEKEYFSAPEGAEKVPVVNFN